MNKKISRRKQITRQNSFQKNFGWVWGIIDPVKICLSSSLISM